MSEPWQLLRWSDRLVELVADVAEAARFERGVHLVRDGAVTGVRAVRGSVSAAVRGSSGRGYRTALAVLPFALASCTFAREIVTANGSP